MCAWQLCMCGPFPGSLARKHQLNGKVALHWCVPKPLLSRKSPLSALFSWQISLAFLWQTSLSLPISHCLSPPLWHSLLSLKPWACSSHQRPSPFLLRGDQCHYFPSSAVTSHLCRTRSAKKGKCLGERQNPVTTALSPPSQKSPPLSTVQ